MGRYAYEKFMMRFSYGLQCSIAAELCDKFGIDKDDFDWNVIDMRVKRADMQQRHRFIDTIRKLEAFLLTEDAKYYCESGRHIVSVAEAARITGRDRKTIVDWSDKDLLAKHRPTTGRRRINVELSIEKLKKSIKSGR